MTQDEQIEMEKLKADLKMWQEGYVSIWKNYKVLMQKCRYLEIDVDRLKRSIKMIESTH